MAEPLSEKRRRLVQHLKEMGYLKTARVIKAFEEVSRELFIPAKMSEHAYSDEPLPIGSGQTISAPHMVAIMTELLEPRKGDKVFELGAGSGYQAAILSKLVSKVYTVELVPELAEKASKALAKAGCKNVEVMVGDGSKGWEEHAPFDKAIATCACPEIPKAVIEQLKEGGIIAAPVGSEWVQELIVGRKKKGKLLKERHGSCVFVPLRH
jgi:protein-L-isoaspartate(D-aspartate) O-methyltransferase